MAKKVSKPASKIPKNFTESEVGALVEHFDESLKLIAEGQVSFREDVKRDFGKVWTEMISMKQEMRSNFKTVFEYLSRIDDELAEIKARLKKLDEAKVDRKEFNILERRLAEAERAIEECRMQLRAAKN